MHKYFIGAAFGAVIALGASLFGWGLNAPDAKAQQVIYYYGDPTGTDIVYVDQTDIDEPILVYNGDRQPVWICPITPTYVAPVYDARTVRQTARRAARRTARRIDRRN